MARSVRHVASIWKFGVLASIEGVCVQGFGSNEDVPIAYQGPGQCSIRRSYKMQDPPPMDRRNTCAAASRKWADTADMVIQI
jgi:hypothetical protein